MQEDKHTKIRLREWLKKEHPFRYLFFEEFGSFPIIAIPSLSYIICFFILAKNGNVPFVLLFIKTLIVSVGLTYEFICSKKRWKQTYCLSLDLDCEIYPDEQQKEIERIIKRERNRSVKRIFLGVVLAVILFIIALTMFK